MSLLDQLNKILNPSGPWMDKVKKVLTTYVTPGAIHYPLMLLLGLVLAGPFGTVGVVVSGLAAGLGYGLKEYVEVRRGAEKWRSAFDLLWAVGGWYTAMHILGRF